MSPLRSRYLAIPSRRTLLAPRALRQQLWSVKKNEEAAAKKKPKMSAAQLRVQKGESAWRDLFPARYCIFLAASYSLDIPVRQPWPPLLRMKQSGADRRLDRARTARDDEDRVPRPDRRAQLQAVHYARRG